MRWASRSRNSRPPVPYTARRTLWLIVVPGHGVPRQRSDTHRENPCTTPSSPASTPTRMGRGAAARPHRDSRPRPRQRRRGRATTRRVWLAAVLEQPPLRQHRALRRPRPRARRTACGPTSSPAAAGVSSARTVWIMSHLDIVPPGDRLAVDGRPVHAARRGWQAVRSRRRGQPAGGGVEPAGGARASWSSGVRPPVDLALLFCADEETGSRLRRRATCAEHHRSCSDPATCSWSRTPATAEGTLRGGRREVASGGCEGAHTTGKQCHGSTPQLGINAFRAAERPGDSPRVAVHHLPGSRTRCSTRRSAPSSPPRRRPTSPTSTPSRATTCSTSTAACCPDTPSPTWRRRSGASPPRSSGARASRSPSRTSSAPRRRRPPASTAPWCAACSAAIRQVHGVTPEPRGIGGGTVAAVFRRSACRRSSTRKHRGDRPPAQRVVPPRQPDRRRQGVRGDRAGCGEVT